MSMTVRNIYIKHYTGTAGFCFNCFNLCCSCSSLCTVPYNPMNKQTR